MIRFKPEVRIVHFTPELAGLLAAASLWSLRARIDVEVNSIDDGAGVHKPTTRHGFSIAVDLDTVGDRVAELRALAEYLWRCLPPWYDVVFEGDHVHVEYDPHRPAMPATPARTLGAGSIADVRDDAAPEISPRQSTERDPND